MASYTPVRTRITGTGSAFPELRVTNDDLAKKVETSDEWIRERTGIAERRISAPGKISERNSGLAVQAALRALEMAGKKPEDIDLILCATCTPDTLIPSTACWIQKSLGAKKAWAMDLNGACSGFVYALHTANQFLKAGTSSCVLVVGSDVLSAFTNWEDRGSCILFADGAGAAILEPTPEGQDSEVFSVELGSDGNLWDYFHIEAGGSNQAVTPELSASRADKMKMKGPEMFKVAVRTLTDSARTVVERSGLTLKDVAWVLPHQANLRIIEAVAKRLDIPMTRVLTNIEKFGNTSSATVPTVLDQAVRSGKIQRGQILVLDVFGAGLTWGAMALRF